MSDAIESLIEDFEQGRLTRRQLTVSLTALVTLGAQARAGRAQTDSTFSATGLDHIALDVTDVGRSRDFYVRHLGLEVASESASSCFLDCGDDFVALFYSRRAGMNHYCYSIRDYDVELAAEKLRAQGIEPRVTGRRIYFPDPDGLTVQLAD